MLFSHQVDPELLMNRANAIVALNGTSALEATLKYNKISFVFSENPFLGMPGIIRVKSHKEFRRKYSKIKQKELTKLSPAEKIETYLNSSSGNLNTLENSHDFAGVLSLIKAID